MGAFFVNDMELRKNLASVRSAAQRDADGWPTTVLSYTNLKAKNGTGLPGFGRQNGQGTVTRAN